MYGDSLLHWISFTYDFMTYGWCTSRRFLVRTGTVCRSIWDHWSCLVWMSILNELLPLRDSLQSTKRNSSILFVSHESLDLPYWVTCGSDIPYRITGQMTTYSSGTNWLYSNTIHWYGYTDIGSLYFRSRTSGNIFPKPKTKPTLPLPKYSKLTGRKTNFLGVTETPGIQYPPFSGQASLYIFRSTCHRRIRSTCQHLRT